jgi:hypothetical protein
MLHEIGGEVDRVDVVAVDEVCALEGVVELMEKLAQSGGLCHAIGHIAVLDLYAGAGGNGLPLGGLADEVAAQEHGITKWTGACRDKQPSQRRCSSDVGEGRSRRL